MKRWLYSGMIGLLLAGTQTVAWANVKQDWSWEPAREGPTAVAYIVQCQLEGEDWETVGTVEVCRITVKHPHGNSRIRVAGIAADGSQGPWSDPSDWYMDRPTSPGRPKSKILP